jgi:hypothetical protein
MLEGLVDINLQAELAQEFLNNYTYKQVIINNQKNLFKQVGEVKPPNWKFPPFIIDDDEQFRNQIGVVAAINACYWNLENGELKRWGVDYQKEGETKSDKGAFGMFKIIADNLDFEDNFASRLESLSEKDFKTWAKPGKDFVKLPMIRKRVQHLREVGKVLNELYQGDFNVLAENCDYDVVRISGELVQNFPTAFGQDRHETTYGNLVFDKRANLCPLQWWGRNQDKFTNIDNLGAVPDYRLPMTLEKLGFMTFKPELKNKVYNNKIMTKDSLLEHAYRAGTIVCSKNIMDNTGMNMAQVDYFLWKNGRDIPEHPLVRTLNY